MEKGKDKTDWAEGGGRWRDFSLHEFDRTGCETAYVSKMWYGGDAVPAEVGQRLQTQCSVAQIFQNSVEVW